MIATDREAADPETIARLAEAAAAAFAATPIVVAYAYGSRVWGAPHANSDLDVGYFLTPDGPDRLPLADELRLAEELSRATGIEVDLRALAAAPLGLRGRALVEGLRVFSGDAVARVTLERELLGRYLDYRPKLEALRALRFASQAARKG